MLLIPVIYRELLSAEDRTMVLKPFSIDEAFSLLRENLYALLERIDKKVNPILAPEGEEKVGFFSRLFGQKREARPFFRGLNLSKLPPLHDVFALELYLGRDDRPNAIIGGDFTVIPFKNFSVCMLVLYQKYDDRTASDLAREISKRYKNNSATLFVRYKIFAGYVFIDTDETNLFYRANPYKGTYYRDYRYKKMDEVAEVVKKIVKENEKYLKDYSSKVPIPKWLQTIPFEKTSYRVGEFEIKVGFAPTASEKDILVEPVFITSAGSIRVKDFLKMMELSDKPDFTMIDALLIWAIDKTKNPIQLFFEKNISEEKIPLIPTYLMRYILSSEYALKI